MVELLESGEARRREASGDALQRQQAEAERARKAVKASRDKKLGRKAAEDALQEDASGEIGNVTRFTCKYRIDMWDWCAGASCSMADTAW